MSFSDQTDDIVVNDNPNQGGQVDVVIIPEQPIINIIPDQPNVLITPLPPNLDPIPNAETSITKELPSPIVWDTNQKSQYGAYSNFDFFNIKTLFPPDAAHGYMDKWRYNFDILNGPTSIVFVDATLSRADIAMGYHLEYNSNGILWRANAAGTPHPDDYLKFMEQNRIIEATTAQTVQELAATNVPQQTHPGWSDPLPSMRVRGSTVEEQKSNMFGWVRSDGNKLHQGVDYVAPVGTTALAIRKGTIVEINNDPTSTSSYGSYIIVRFEQDGKTYYALYAHLSQINARVGQSVEPGQVIGLTGTSGNAAGMQGEEQHLHFEIATSSSFGNGLDTRIDPMPFLLMNNNQSNNSSQTSGDNNTVRKYVVQSGDVLWNIARANNTTVAAIAKLSNIDDPDSIYPGQVLLISKYGVPAVLNPTENISEKTNSTIGSMNPSNKLIDFIADYESFRPTPYRVSPHDPPTIGYGHVIQSGENFDGGISEEDAKKLLLQQVTKEYASIVNQWAVNNNVQLNQQQFDALVSFVYNMGSITEEYTPSLIRVVKDKDAPPEEVKRVFGLYRYGADGISPGLILRRRDEADIYLYGDYSRKYD